MAYVENNEMKREFIFPLNSVRTKRKQTTFVLFSTIIYKSRKLNFLAIKEQLSLAHAQKMLNAI